jgi:hypothetical protein
MQRVVETLEMIKVLELEQQGLGEFKDLAICFQEGSFVYCSRCFKRFVQAEIKQSH